MYDSFVGLQLVDVIIILKFPIRDCKAMFTKASEVNMYSEFLMYTNSVFIHEIVIKNVVRVLLIEKH